MARVTELNYLGQPVGAEVVNWSPRAWPVAKPIEGRWCWLEPLDPVRHGAQLFESYRADRSGRLWTYLPYGPFEDFSSYDAWLFEVAHRSDPMFFAIIDGARRALGVASYQRIDPRAGTIEVGHLNFSPALQGSTAATEAMIMMMRVVFDELGYRRYEWKCDALNDASRRAAERLGFTYEGTFRQATVVKGRNRDTAWYSIIDAEWPRLSKIFSQWLRPGNFDADGRQRESLAQLIALRGH